MEIAEQVTFGGSGLDRAAELRNEEAQKRLLKDPKACCLVFWRGKILLTGENRDKTERVGVEHSALKSSSEPLYFLGLDEGAPVFAADVSAWEPDEVDESVGAFVDQSEQFHPEIGAHAAFVDLKQVMTHLSARDAELIVSGMGLIKWHSSHGFCARCGAKSHSSMAGWQRDCPECSAHHFPRTDPVVIMLITHGNRILMGRSPGWPEGMYSLLAGFVEPGETIEAAVRREVYEEAGVRVGQVSYLASQPWPFPASLMFGCEAR